MSANETDPRHDTKPTLWDPEVCAGCGFRLDQHQTLYGFDPREGS